MLHILHPANRALAVGRLFYYISRIMRLDELAGQIDAAVVGDGSIDVTDVAPLEDATGGSISFLAKSRFQKQLETTGASAVIVAPNVDCSRLTLLKTKDPYLAFARTVVLLRGHRKHPFTGVHPKANVDPTAKIGEGTVIYPGAFIGPRVTIGRDSIIYPNVCIYENCVIGDRVILHSNTTVGVDGFGYAFNAGVHHKIPQIGNVVIENDVEVGANCTIARAALARTIIGAGTKIDAQVMIAHNCIIGKGSILVAQVGLAGSVTVGSYVTLAGQVGVAGHLKIGDGAIVAAKSGVTNDIEPGATMMGAPAIPASECRRVFVAMAKLPEIVQRIREIENQLAELSESGDTPIA
jgi:UDP-3-O-[3-hydroxymyristoyl] glucosamine N-acyltransferase